MEELIYQESYTLQTTDLNMHKKLRPARLLELVQLVSGHHAEALGWGDALLVPRHLAWVVVRQKIEISRMPGQGESLAFTTWPGREMHGLCPRYMEICTADGESLIRLCFLWVIMDLEKRLMIQPSSIGLKMPAAERAPLMPLPRLPRQLLEPLRREVFTVPYGFVDILGHMNNTRYLEMAENMIEAPCQGKELREVLIEFTHEIRLGESMIVSIGREGDVYHIKGRKGEQDIITLCLQYQ